MAAQRNFYLHVLRPEGPATGTGTGTAAAPANCLLPHGGIHTPALFQRHAVFQPLAASATDHGDPAHAITVVIVDAYPAASAAQPEQGALPAPAPAPEDDAPWPLEQLAGLRAQLPRSAFLLVWHPGAVSKPGRREEVMRAGASMVSCVPEHLHQALERISAPCMRAVHAPAQGGVACPWCGLAGLSAEALWLHAPLHHINQPVLKGACPACGTFTRNLTKHINRGHGPHGPEGPEDHTGVFALAVVRRRSDGRFLMVQERYQEGYWVPGGGVDRGESLAGGCVREVLEEAGVHVRITGILTVESMHGGEWRRIIFTAEPLPGYGHECKTLPDVESAGAAWVRAERVADLPLRCSSEPLTWIPHVAARGKVYPLDSPPAEVAQVFGREYPLL